MLLFLLASLWGASLQKHLLAVDPENHRQAKGNGSYYLLNKAEVPTVIVECGFLSNYEEAEKLFNFFCEHVEFPEEDTKKMTESLMSLLDGFLSKNGD